ncbi:alpha-L-rhamnosidase-like protein [Flavobacterium sp. 1]|uniref:alpha-L-rhamnosidase-related protein n=1 Tax=Flavobacterium sp. 1 TaxID=2035200 RepID=UPI000CBAD7AC|nr:alpha-L-rhamnosidase C-terminal domain-containing protein [Flavobacterium sp. 1]PJJ08137.1 alpha-L-rhamnosidase-like protein [Flavobacterium sp. 1]
MRKENLIRPLLMSKMILLFFLSLHLSAQKKSISFDSTRFSVQQATEINPELLRKPWTAKWISFPDNSNTDYGIYLFRKEISIQTKPEKFIIHVSADNRYKLYINGVYVCNGPARSHLFKWNFESIDISPYLHSGKNIISAIVWNFGWHRPLAQISGHTGFIIQGNTKEENAVNSDNSWVVLKNTAYKTISVNINQYYAAGDGEEFDCEKHPWNWMDTDFDVTEWKQAQVVETGKPVGCMGEWGEPSIHLLSPREIPFMEEKEQRFFKIRRSDIINVPAGFLNGKTPITIAANSKVKLLIDQNVLTTAYPVLNFSKGGKSTIKLTYAESLLDSKGNKGNRNDIENKQITGNSDVIICDGENNRIFQTLWWRTFRYIEMEVETKEEPLVLNDFYSIFSAYPLEEKASFHCDNSQIKDIWNVGWRTQRLCANETFFDCPYYEQLQYIGDARIQALVSTYVSGDFRLTKNAIAVLHESQLPIGITQSRFPSSNLPQIIPPFSLVWVTMVYDYWMLNDDSDFVKAMIPGMQETLNWFRNRIDSNGMLGPVEWWDFVDWTYSKGWDNGNPPATHTGNSSILSLQYVYTLEKAAAIFDTYKMYEIAVEYRDLADKIKTAVFEKCYDSNKGLIADSPEKDTFSQHANILAILTNTFSETTDKAKIVSTLLNDKDLAQCTLYFKFYLFEALEKAGQANQFTAVLTPWRKMVDSGLTTFAETPDPTRSDCHAWSASPVYYFLSLVSGIKPNAPGFKSVRIEPNFGDLKNIDATMPHKLGTIRVKLQKDKNNVSGEITLPIHLDGVFIWKGVQRQLKGGINNINFPAGNSKQ